MSNTFVNIIVIGLTGFTLFLAVYAYVSARKRKSGAQSASKAFETWMAAQNFVPDHSSSFGGTGIAFRNQDQRLALQSKDVIKFYEPAELLSLRTYSSTVSSRPLGAAPGVVEVKQIEIFNLDIAIKTLADPLRVIFESEDEMRQWEQRIGALIDQP